MVVPLLVVAAGMGLGGYIAYKLLPKDEQKDVDKVFHAILKQKYNIEIEGEEDLKRLKKDLEKRNQIKAAMEEATEKVKYD